MSHIGQVQRKKAVPPMRHLVYLPAHRAVSTVVTLAAILIAIGAALVPAAAQTNPVSPVAAAAAGARGTTTISVCSTAVTIAVTGARPGYEIDYGTENGFGTRGGNFIGSDGTYRASFNLVADAGYSLNDPYRIVVYIGPTGATETLVKTTSGSVGNGVTCPPWYPTAGPAGAGSSFYDVTDLSCVTLSFCVAVNSAGDVAVRRAKTWTVTASTLAAVAPTAVSCRATTFCVAVGAAGTSAVYDGSSWSTAAIPGLTTTAADVSCGAVSKCVAIDTRGSAYTFSGTWSAGVRFDRTGARPTAVSCARSTLCMAVDSAGSAYLLSGRKWIGAGTAIAGGAYDVACTSATFCAASNGIWQAATFDGTVWSATTDLGHVSPYGAKSLSCAPGTAFCVVVDNGQYATHDVNGWHPTARFGGGADNISSVVQCPSAGACLEVDGGGAAFEYRAS